MPLSDIVKSRLIACTPDTSITKVAEMMKSQDVGAVLICDKNQKPVGICTDRDIVLRCIAGKLPVDSKVESVMSKSPTTVSLDDGIQDVISEMRKHAIRRVPVVDSSGKAVGLVSFGDIVGLLAKELRDISKDTPVDVAA